jgi:hypothetical protein
MRPPNDPPPVPYSGTGLASHADRCASAASFATATDEFFDAEEGGSDDVHHRLEEQQRPPQHIHRHSRQLAEAGDDDDDLETVQGGNHRHQTGMSWEAGTAM